MSVAMRGKDRCAIEVGMRSGERLGECDSEGQEEESVNLEANKRKKRCVRRRSLSSCLS